MNVGYNTLPLTAFKFVSTYYGQNGSLTRITESEMTLDKIYISVRIIM